MKTARLFITTVAACTALGIQAQRVAHFDMEAKNGAITETVTGETFTVAGNFGAENRDGVVGKALLFDGYTTHVAARLDAIIPSGSKTMTFSVWVAMAAYPVIQIDVPTDEKTPIVSCLDNDNKKGFGFFIDKEGHYSFETYISGWPVSVKADSPLPTYQWNNLVAVVDCNNRSVKVYHNGLEVANGKANGDISFDGGPLYMGQGPTSRQSGPFELMSLGGLIDEVTIRNDAVTPADIQAWQTSAVADLSIPQSRFDADLLRPRFHGMPEAGWTNECHGMTYSNGRYHLFFQKNANGPYMARLHWGHLSSENLYDWKEEKIALAPDTAYDIKGCWSGCVFSDETITGGKINAIYTAVDYAKATIALAEPADSDLISWKKSSRNPLINGRPTGLSDDFRDPYFFRNGDNAYIIVGTSKNGVGATTLHRYNAASSSWTNDGSVFFAGTEQTTEGTFWEMPVVAQMGDGKWLFAATPLATAEGVHTLYWTGQIADDGSFRPDAQWPRPRLVELNSKDGFGLLSPTICQHDNKTIALGIVPDKLASNANWQLGWAHCYTLPREWSLGDDGNLIQKPYAGLSGLRTTTQFDQSDFELDGTLNLSPVGGREVEICGTFEVGGSPVGFNFFKTDDNAQATLTYEPAEGTITFDFTALPRLINDEGVYDGIYTCTLPEKPAAGSTLKINLFIDHSILDLFVNDRWATSIRVFPTAGQAEGLEAFADGRAKVVSLKAWRLRGTDDSTGIGGVRQDVCTEGQQLIDVYDVWGRRIRTQVQRAKATENLPRGIYVADGKKVICR